jgi:S-DNA-T family DNA segregation ATPase FtsK/SpoIIIE
MTRRWAGDRIEHTPHEVMIRPRIRQAWSLVILLGVVQGVAALVCLAGRHLWVTGAAAVLAAAWGRYDWRVTAVIAGSVVVLLVAWRLSHRASFAVWVGVPARSSWRREIVYRRHWQPAMVLADLADTYTRHDYLPVLTRVVADGAADRVLVKMLAGQEPEDYENAAGRLAHTFAARTCRVRLDRPGWIWLVFTRTDPLAELVAPLSVHGLVDLAAVPLGSADVDTITGRRHATATASRRVIGWVRRRPSPAVPAAPDPGPGVWVLRLLGAHVLIAGASGSGKGSVLWSLLRALSPSIRAGVVQAWAIDPKGGMELSPGQAMFHQFAYATAADACELLEDAVDLMRRRAERLRGVTRLHEPAPGDPLVVVVVDELAALTAYATDRDLKRRIHAALSLLLSQGRAVGVLVVAALQDPRKDVLPFRDLFTIRIALRMTEPEQVDMVLGDGARSRGATADHIPLSTPGVGYVVLDGVREPVRVRASWSTDDDIAALAAGHLPDTPAALTDDGRDGWPPDMEGGDAGRKAA